MYYYEVLVGDTHYHGNSALTYSHNTKLLPGSVVRIALRERSVLGIIDRAVAKPTFSTKPVSAAASAPPLPAEILDLMKWLASYYPAPFGTIIRQFLPPSVAFPKLVKDPNPLPRKSPTELATTTTPDKIALPPLTDEQKSALKTMASGQHYLLHGITGSGKTRLYIELARKSLNLKKSAVVLTPEIGLTAQLTESFTAEFGNDVFVLHSRLSAAERRDIWYELLSSTRPRVIIGPRSALFAPVRHIGLIVIDESHDQAYKNDAAPYYRTERVAARLAELHHASLVYGSATPNVEDYFLAESKKVPIVRLSELAVQTKYSPAIASLIVDMRDRSNFSRSEIISTVLLEAVQLALQNHEQTMLFLNRRGTASSILCSSCGWQALCQHCDLALTYHGDTHITRCHICGRTKPLPNKCPDCGAVDILLKTIGTKAVVEEIKRLFPQARLQRFDSDVAKADQIENQLVALQAGKADIIIGTQMITKGLDLPGLAVVGILSADSSLLIPDYTANERTFQLLSQVIGRVGRGHRAGSVVVQTYNPSHPTILAAIEKDWTDFYARELAERQAYLFPPYTFLLKLTCLRATSLSAENNATKLKQQIEKSHPRLRVEGPSAAFHPRESGKYKWQLIVKSPSRQTLVDIASNLPSGWQHDLDPVNLL